MTHHLHDKVLHRPVELALHAPVRVVHQVVERASARPQRLLQSGEHEVCVQGAGDVPADDVAREDVDDEGAFNRSEQHHHE